MIIIVKTIHNVLFRGINYVLFHDNNTDESSCVNIGSCCLQTCSFRIIPVTCWWRIIYSTNIDSAGSRATSVWKKQICFRDRHASWLQVNVDAFRSKMFIGMWKIATAITRESNKVRDIVSRTDELEERLVRSLKANIPVYARKKGKITKLNFFRFVTPQATIRTQNRPNIWQES